MITIVSDIQQINVHTKNITDQEVLLVALQLQIFSLVFLMSMQSLKRYPENFGIILTSRMLTFYKLFKYFKKLIDESDLFSPTQSSLLCCHQYLHPPGGGLLLTLDCHKAQIKTTVLDIRFLITCSDCINFFVLETMETIGNNKYPEIFGINKQLETVEKTRVYYNKRPQARDRIVEEFDGGYVIMTASTIMSIKFDTQVNFSKQFSASEIADIFVIPNKYLFVQFKNTKYCEIYNIFTGELVEKETFDSLVKFVICSFDNNYAVEMPTTKNAEFVVALERGEIQKYVLVHEEKFKFQLLYRIPPVI